MTDSQSVCLSWCRAPSGAHDQIFNSVESYSYRTENTASIIAYSLVAKETPYPQSCSLATAVVLSLVYAAVTWQRFYMSQYKHLQPWIPQISNIRFIDLRLTGQTRSYRAYRVTVVPGAVLRPWIDRNCQQSAEWRYFWFLKEREECCLLKTESPSGLLI
jgi:hypothetical protein